MTTLTDFLLARIAEDEADVADPAAALHYAPDRVLAECEAKRRIVERHSGCDEVSYGDTSTCPDARDLALPYADHPDYRPEWKP